MFQSSSVTGSKTNGASNGGSTSNSTSSTGGTAAATASSTAGTLGAVKPAPDPKPVECNLCHRKFKNIPALNGHMRLHGGYFKKVIQLIQSSVDVSILLNYLVVSEISWNNEIVYFH